MLSHEFANSIIGPKRVDIEFQEVQTNYANFGH